MINNLKSNLSSYGVGVLCALALLTCTSILSLHAAENGTETPDFSGIYPHGHSKASRGGDGTYVNQVQPTAEAVAIMDDYDPADDFVIRCEPMILLFPGLKRQLLHPYPMKITQDAETLTFWYEGWEAERTVHINGEFPELIEPSKLGYSIGHFEGDDIVIETRGLTGGFINEVSGLQFSEDAEFTERYTRFSDPADNHIALHLTIDDPRRFEEPMIISDAWRWDPTTMLLEYECLIPEEHGIGR